MKSKILSISVIIFSILLIAGHVDSLVIKSVSISSNEISPGENTRIGMVIENNGEEIVEDVSINLDLTNLPFAPYDSGVDDFIDEIKDSDDESAEFDIIAFNDAKAGIYKIPVKISYKEIDEIKVQQSLISLQINSKPLIEASYEDGILLKGQKNKVAIKIINKGLSDAKFLEIEAGGSVLFTTISQSNVYIGDVDSNDYQTVEFDVFFRENVPSVVNFPVTIKYKDFKNKEYSESSDISLKVYSKDQAEKLGLLQKNNTIYIVIIIIVLVIVFLIYRTIRKRRKQD